MASGQTLIVFTPLHNTPKSTSYAQLALRNSHPVIDFDASTQEEAYFHGFMPRNYAGGGVTVTLVWMAASATSGNVVWDVAFEREESGGTDLDADSFATAQVASAAAANGTSGALTYTTVGVTNGANMDSVAAGEAFRLRVRRVAADGSDTMTGDAELLLVEIKET